MIVKELEFLVKAITRSPKSYTLWFHRQWIIEKGLEYERQMMKDQWQSKILEMELKLCDKLLGMDPRNFHCWNYRLQIVEIYLDEMSKRIKKEDPWNTQKEFIQKECVMAESMIKKNFSNFSAWHYRGKLMVRYYEKDEDLYLIPFEKIQEDFALLKHAFYTDPKDQSPWNYHEWLLSLLTPVQIVSVYLKEQNEQVELILGLSHKVIDFNKLQIKLLDQEGKEIFSQKFQITTNNNRQISSSWKIAISNQDINSYNFICLSIRGDKNFRLTTVDQKQLFRNFFIHLRLQDKKFELPSSEVWQQDNQQIQNLKEVIYQEISTIKELTDFEKDLRYALLRLQELQMMKYEYLANPYYCDAGSIEIEPLNDISDQIDQLKKDLLECDGKDHGKYYEKMNDSFTDFRFRWDKVYESGTLLPFILDQDQNKIADRHMGFFGY